MFTAIAHPTDLSPLGASAFEHALGLALAGRSRLDLLHVGEPGAATSWKQYPHVREVLQRWGALEPGAPAEAVHAVTGIAVRKVGIHDSDAVDGLMRFVREHGSDLIVMASHGRAGLERLRKGSVSAELAQVTQVPTLIFGPMARPFVDSGSGKLSIGKLLVPVDHAPDPHAALTLLEGLAEGLGATLDLLHVGPNPPVLRDGAQGARRVRTLDGPVVETLLAEAEGASLVAMPMEGSHGLVDALRGSTTERMVREVSCPVLAIPVAR